MVPKGIAPINSPICRGGLVGPPTIKKNSIFFGSDLRNFINEFIGAALYLAAPINH